MSEKNFKPFISADQQIPEVTLQSVLLGTVLGVILAAANTYLALYAGMTVSASIPAAVLSMGILRGVLKRGTILENNIVQTIAASGEALASGVVFTVPALLLTGVWTEIAFWPTTLICITGGLLGIIFMVPLRKTHIVEDQSLVFPEGVACAEVLIAGEKGGSGAKYVFISMLFSATFKFFTGGLSIFKGTLEGAWTFANTAFYMGCDLSPALLGVGYIVGFNIGIVAATGSIITWLITIPLMGTSAPIQGDALEWFWGAWSTQGRYLGVGAMIVGGVSSLIEIRGALFKGLQESIMGYKAKSETKPIRTEENIANKHLLLLLIATVITIFLLYLSMIESVTLSAFSTVLMVVLSFGFVAVASYVCGLVGSSNSPVSGMTICCLLFTAGLFSVLGFTGAKGILATLGVAGVVCCAVASAGDISQDLKTGYLIGATPKKQQWMEVVGAIIPSLVIAPVMIVLSKAYGIGTGQPGALKAPQATLFASVTKAIFGQGDGLPWKMLIIGTVIGLVALVIDKKLAKKQAKFRIPVMALAVGMYLPLSLNIPILLGGVIAWLAKNASETGSGILFSSGLVAGEAIAGVIMGGIIYFNKNSLPVTLIDSNWVSFIGLAILCGSLFMAAKAKKSI